MLTYYWPFEFIYEKLVFVYGINTNNCNHLEKDTNAHWVSRSFFLMYGIHCGSVYSITPSEQEDLRYQLDQPSHFSQASWAWERASVLLEVTILTISGWARMGALYSQCHVNSLFANVSEWTFLPPVMPTTDPFSALLPECSFINTNLTNLFPCLKAFNRSHYSQNKVQIS